MHQLPDQLDTHSAASALSVAYAQSWLGLRLHRGSSCSQAAAQLQDLESGCAAVTSSQLPLQGPAVLLQLPAPELDPKPASRAAAGGMPCISEDAVESSTGPSCSAPELALLLWAHTCLQSDDSAGEHPDSLCAWCCMQAGRHVNASAGSILTSLLDFLLLSPAEAAGLPLARFAAAQLLQQVVSRQQRDSRPWQISKDQAGHWAAAFVQSLIRQPPLGHGARTAAEHSCRGWRQGALCLPELHGCWIGLNTVAVCRLGCWDHSQRGMPCICCPRWRRMALQGSSLMLASQGAALRLHVRGWCWTEQRHAACRLALWQLTCWWLQEQLRRDRIG